MTDILAKRAVLRRLVRMVHASYPRPVCCFVAGHRLIFAVTRDNFYVAGCEQHPEWKEAAVTVTDAFEAAIRHAGIVGDGAMC